MKKILLTLFIMSNFLSSCQTKFDKQVWKYPENNNPSKIKNPRKKMTKDLIDNYLKKGLNKKELITLLGKPIKDTIDVYLPDNKSLPDSLSMNNSNYYNLTREEKEKRRNNINYWYKNNYVKVHIMKYPIGWDTMDSKSLIIILDDNDNLEKVFIKQH